MLKLQAQLNHCLPLELFFEIKRIIKKCRSMPEVYLFSACEKHGRDAHKEYERNPRFNLNGAEQLTAAFLALKDEFSQFTEEQQIGLKAAMYYFALNDDGNPDFATFDGLDDDIIVANACFSFAGKKELCIYPKS